MMDIEEGEEDDTTADSLYRRLLPINFYEVIEHVQGGYKEKKRQVKDVPRTFESVQEYIDVFEPLMIEECYAMLGRGRVEAEEIPEPAKCATVSSSQKGQFLIVTMFSDESVVGKLKARDVLVISKDDPWGELEKFRIGLTALAVVEGRDSNSKMKMRFCFPSGDNLRSSEKIRAKAMSGALATPDTGFWMAPHANLSTLLREWQALHSMKNIVFKDVLLSGCAPEKGLTAMKVPPAMEAALKLEYNESQMQALMGGLNGQPIVLIQGPPGTGKTRTLLGLLSIVLHAAPKGSIGVSSRPTTRIPATRTAEETTRLWKLANPWLSGKTIPRDTVKPWEEGSISDVFGLLNVAKPVKISRKFVPKAHVLVCAPSNSALDEIVIRLLISGIIDRTGQKYAPNIVRVGLKPHHLVQSVQLDTLVDGRIARMTMDKGKQGVNFTERERIKMAVIEEAHIVCCTLSFAGSPLLQRISRPFDVVVIDEAAQAVEPATLIPLCTGAKQVYLIGDPLQLPATVVSKRAVDHFYDVSLFRRLEMNNWPVNVLDTQYRMHPQIATFPSAFFYKGNLKDGPGVLESTKREWHTQNCLGPFAFFDVKGTEGSTEDGTSYLNTLEAELVMEIFLAFVERYPNLKGRSSSIAIISPYKGQVDLLKKTFRAALGDSAKDVDINTIDGFQGREKDIAIFSAVRSDKAGKIGFVADERRINVGLTRARCSMIVVGNEMALREDPVWTSLLRHSRLERKLFRARKPFDKYLKRAILGEEAPEGPTRYDLMDDMQKQQHYVRHERQQEEEDALSDSSIEDEQQHKTKRRNMPQTAEELAAKKAKHK